MLESDRGADLFRELSWSAEPLSTGRVPATEWMHVMLQEGGVLGRSEDRHLLQRWIEGAPNGLEVKHGIGGIQDPETAGRAMRHLFDAAYRRHDGGGFVLLGYDESGAGPVHFGVRSGDSNGDHWEKTVAHFSRGVGKWFGEQAPARKRAIAQGYLGSDG